MAACKWFVVRAKISAVALKPYLELACTPNGNDVALVKFKDGTEECAVFVREGEDDDFEADIEMCLARLPVVADYEDLTIEELADGEWERIINS